MGGHKIKKFHFTFYAISNIFRKTIFSFLVFFAFYAISTICRKHNIFKSHLIFYLKKVKGVGGGEVFFDKQ